MRARPYMCVYACALARHHTQPFMVTARHRHIASHPEPWMPASRINYRPIFRKFTSECRRRNQRLAQIQPGRVKWIITDFSKRTNTLNSYTEAVRDSINLFRSFRLERNWDVTIINGVSFNWITTNTEHRLWDTRAPFANRRSPRSIHTAIQFCISIPFSFLPLSLTLLFLLFLIALCIWSFPLLFFSSPFTTVPTSVSLFHTFTYRSCVLTHEHCISRASRTVVICFVNAHTWKVYTFVIGQMCRDKWQA